MYILNNPYAELNTPAVQFKQPATRKNKNIKVSKTKNIRGHKTMGHYRAPSRKQYVHKVRNSVQKTSKSRRKNFGFTKRFIKYKNNPYNRIGQGAAGIAGSNIPRWLGFWSRLAVITKI